MLLLLHFKCISCSTLKCTGSVHKGSTFDQRSPAVLWHKYCSSCKCTHTHSHTQESRGKLCRQQQGQSQKLLMQQLKLCATHIELLERLLTDEKYVKILQRVMPLAVATTFCTFMLWLPATFLPCIWPQFVPLFCCLCS